MDLHPSPLKQSGRLSAVREETLAERLTEGPLPLAFALHCATDVAAVLRELHLDGRAHGAVTPDSILLRPSGGVLPPPSFRSDQASPHADVAAFGSVLYEMLAGCKPPEGVGAPSGPVPRTGPAGLRAAATRLAIRCLASPADARPAMQQVVTEVRLLWVMAREFEPKPPPPPQRVPIPVVRKSSAPEPQRLPVPVAQNDATLPPDPLISAPVAQNDSASPADQPIPAPPACPADPAVPAPPADEPTPGPPLSGHRCPSCFSFYVYESRPRSGFERLLCSMGSPIRRCHQCYHRYFVFLGLSFAKKLPL